MSRLPALIMGSTVNVMPGLQLQALAGLAVVQDLRLLVEALADAVAAEFAHDAESWLSACRWIALPMSPSVAPGRTVSIPFHMHS
jgi:hypothetical protein